MVKKLIQFIKLYRNAKKAIPPLEEKDEFDGLQGITEILWDEWHIPHIFAKNPDDAFFMIGYLHARFRLFQMEIYRRRFSGTLSEVFGEAALDWDKYMREVGLYRVAQENAAKIRKNQESDVYKKLTAYCNGVNQSIEKCKEHPPMEFHQLGYHPEPWTIEDVFLLISVLDWMESKNLPKEVLREHLLSMLDEETADKIFPLFKGGESENAVGSNAWVLSPDKTAIESNILANDPHLAFSLPMLWFMVHVQCPDFNVIGVTLPGNPGIIIGHNKHIAWGITNTIADTQDLFKIEVNPENDGQYRYNGKWVDFTLINSPIKIKQEDGAIKTLDFTIKETPFGPLIHSFEYGFEMHPIELEGSYALKWTGHTTDIITTVENYVKMNWARNWDEFQQNLKDFSVVPHNFFFADAEGNVGHQVAGQLPIRGKPISGVPYPGISEEYNWTGRVPFEELPSFYNPETGYLFSGNYNEDKGTKGKHPLSIDDVKPYRYLRLKQLLATPEPLTIEDIQTMQFDTYSLQGEKYTPLFLEYVQREKADPLMKKALEYLEKWDFDLSAESVGGAIFKVWQNEAARQILAPKIGEKMVHIFLEESPFSLERILKSDLYSQEEFKDLMTEGLRQAVEYLKNRIGNNPNDWKWGSIHQVTLRHPFTLANESAKIFNIGPYPVGGDPNTVNNGHPSQAKDYDMVAGASLRQILVPKDWDQSLISIPGGQSGMVYDEGYDNLMKYWVEGKYIPYLFTKKAIKKHLKAESKYYNPIV